MLSIERGDSVSSGCSFSQPPLVFVGKLIVLSLCAVMNEVVVESEPLHA